jgi:hypothetical protein
MRTLLVLAITAAIPASHVLADPAADSFVNIFATTCLKHVADLDQLQKRLERVPKLPSEKAAPFLQGRQGSVWPVPDKHGLFVVAILDQTNVCAVYARRADAGSVMSHLRPIISSAPAPMRVAQLEDARKQDPKNGTTHTVAYEWSQPGASKKFIFTLTTATGESAPLQAMASTTRAQ